MYIVYTCITPGGLHSVSALDLTGNELDLSGCIANSMEVTNGSNELYRACMSRTIMRLRTMQAAVQDIFKLN